MRSAGQGTKRVAAVRVSIRTALGPGQPSGSMVATIQ
jgi:hypothetical protein